MAGRTVHGISAVFLPFDEDGAPDLEAFRAHLARTLAAGLEPAVNMDTGFGPELGPEGRRAVLAVTVEVVAGAPFVAGAMPFGWDGDPIDAYRREAIAISQAGGTPIVFPSPVLASAAPAEIVPLYATITDGLPRALAFELGSMFSPHGRIFDDEVVRGLMDLEQLVGLKHSSLDRVIERRRLALRDEQRPDFRIYTGNDLAIDMVRDGSDYLLGLSTFDPGAFAQRDRWFAADEDRYEQLDDALQALGAVAFREPVPAYKDSAAAYLDLTGGLPGARPHPSCARRPAWERELLAPFAARVADATGRAR